MQLPFEKADSDQQEEPFPHPAPVFSAPLVSHERNKIFEKARLPISAHVPRAEHEARGDPIFSDANDYICDASASLQKVCSS